MLQRLSAGRKRAPLTELSSVLAACITSASAATAGVLNPQISIIGQPLAQITDDPDDPDRGRLRFEPGETEVIFDDALNPYARGYFTLTLGEEGMALEEGYFSILRGLPLALSARGGQFRVPFGRLNQAHPHSLPFAEPLESVSSYLPGDEGFIEPGVQLERRFSIGGIGVGDDASVNLQVACLQGNSFRIERDPSGDPEDPVLLDEDDQALTRTAIVARLSSFSMLGEQSGLEVGISGCSGTNNVAASARTTILGSDAKAKVWTSPRSYVLLQGELLTLDQEVASWTPGEGYQTASIRRAAGYLFVDYNFALRYNLGGSYERFQIPMPGEPDGQTAGIFAGFALMEETMSLRLDWRRASLEGSDPLQTVTFRVIYSMGPHKAHQF
jgi:hypothetical protein